MGDISMSTYGPAAPKSQKEQRAVTVEQHGDGALSETMPVTFEAAEKEPMISGRSAKRRSSCSRWARSMWPSGSSWMVTRSAIDSRQGSSLEWCS